MGGAPGLAAEDDAASVRVEILVAEAEKLYRADKHREAVGRYDQASARAFAEGASGRAFELSRTAAAILQAQGDHRAAGERLRRLAMGNATHPEAAATHRSAIVCLAQTAQEDAAAAQAYEEALTEFLEQWPDSPSAVGVRRWLINWRATQRQWRRLSELLDAIPPEDPNHAASLGLYADATIGLLSEASGKTSTEERRSRLRSATDKLQPIVTGANNQWPQAWGERQRAAALALARIHLAFNEAGPRYPYRLLAAAATGAPPAGEAWRDAALPLLVLAAVEAGELDKAAGWAAQLPGRVSTSAERLVGRLESRVIESLLSESTDAAAEGRVLLTVADRLATDEPPAWLVRGRAAALLALGEPTAAHELLQAIAAGQRGDAGFTRLHAATLARLSDEASRLAALELWRQLESGAAAGGAEWRQARLTRIELLAALGRTEEAQKLLALTAALYPPPTSPGLAGRQQALQRSVGRSAKK